MSASLVGSEMCIRDRGSREGSGAPRSPLRAASGCSVLGPATAHGRFRYGVSSGLGLAGDPPSSDSRAGAS
eukprot:9600365-Alexandrium_andersonii.AAC.1